MMHDTAKSDRTPGDPFISVVIATMCRGPWVESVESALAQDYPSFEVVMVVDRPDCDSQTLDALAAKYPSLKIIRNDCNIGLTRSLNRGLAISRGSIIVRQDDDTFSKKERLRKVADFMLTSGVDIAGSDSSIKFNHSRQHAMEHRLRSDHDIKTALETANCLSHPTLAFSAEAVRRIGGYNETFRYAQDYELYLRAKRNNLVFGTIAEPLVHEELGAQSITISKRRVQMMYSFAALLVHNAETNSVGNVPAVLMRFATRFFVPQSIRTMRHKLIARFSRND